MYSSSVALGSGSVLSAKETSPRIAEGTLSRVISPEFICSAKESASLLIVPSSIVDPDSVAITFPNWSYLVFPSVNAPSVLAFLSASACAVSSSDSYFCNAVTFTAQSIKYFQMLVDITFCIFCIFVFNIYEIELIH